MKTDLFRIIVRTEDAVDSRDADRFLRHLVSLTATKLADGLIDPKLVLAWILGAVGAPGYLIGALVPVRESGALLPQILLAQQIQRRSIRKTFWAVGSAVQGVAAIGIGVAALTLQGAAAGWAVIGCLAVLSLARAACSASYKDVAARTIRPGERGTVSGAAGTLSAAAVFGYAAFLSVGWIPRELIYVTTAILLAGGLWMVAAILFVGLDEPEDDRATDGGTGRVAEVLRPLREDIEFRTYILVRGLLISTALAPPFLVMLSNAGGDSHLGNLGLFMLASSAAAIASSYVWGRASDWSSRRTLLLSGLLATGALGGAGLLGLATGGIGGSGLAAMFIFVAQIAYEGVRAGRKTHLTDMETGGQKAVYTALSNTLIGVLLVLGGGFGVIADLFGAAVVLLIFAGLSAAAAVTALRLREQQVAD